MKFYVKSKDMHYFSMHLIFVIFSRFVETVLNVVNCKAQLLARLYSVPNHARWRMVYEISSVPTSHLSVATIILIQIVFLHYFHLKLFVGDKKGLNTDGILLKIS